MAKKKTTNAAKPRFVPKRLPTESTLRRAIAGEAREFTPVEALGLLEARGGARTRTLLRDVALNSADIDLRANAVAGLGREANRANRSVLSAALEDPEPEVARRAAEALGRIGGAPELERLRALRPKDPVVKRAVETARTLLSYTLGSTRGRIRPSDLTPQLELESSKTRPITAATASPELLEGTLGQLQREVPGLPLAGVAHTVDCGKAQYLVAFHRDVAKRKRLDALKKGSTVIGVLFRRAQIDGAYYRYGHVLGHPGPGASVRVFVMRDSGEVAYSGELTLGRDTARFSISALSSRHTRPIAFEGTLAHGSLALEVEHGAVAIDKSPAQPTAKRPRQIRTQIA